MTTTKCALMLSLVLTPLIVITPMVGQNGGDIGPRQYEGMPVYRVGGDVTAPVAEILKIWFLVDKLARAPKGAPFVVSCFGYYMARD
jgi:hypothetical protein